MFAGTRYVTTEDIFGICIMNDKNTDPRSNPFTETGKEGNCRSLVWCRQS